MDYLGSKKRLIDKILPLIKGTKVLDACSGSGFVSQELIKAGYQTYSSDLLHFPGCIIRGTVGLTKEEKEEITQFINEPIPKLEGFFFKNYTGYRLYFTEENALLLDGLRQKIETINNSKIKDFLIYCGMEGMSRVQNVCGLQASFLPKLRDCAYKKLELRFEKSIEGKSTFFRNNLLNVISENWYDTIYVDPPYNERQYGKTYHLYETFARNDNPEIFGKTGQRKTLDEPSEFCSKVKVESAFIKLYEKAKCKKLIISYNSEGNLSKDKFINLFGAKIIEFDITKYTAVKESTAKKIQEYIIVIDK